MSPPAVIRNRKAGGFHHKPNCHRHLAALYFALPRHSLRNRAPPACATNEGIELQSCGQVDTQGCQVQEMGEEADWGGSGFSPVYTPICGYRIFAGAKQKENKFCTCSSRLFIEAIPMCGCNITEEKRIVHYTYINCRILPLIIAIKWGSHPL
jgi:hypothetical protein